MLPRSQRLNLKKDFKWVAQGKKIDTKYLKLFIRVSDTNFPRVGIAVSSKNFRKASGRNRARRLVSSAFESLYSRLPNGINIVALPKPGVIKVKSDDVLTDLQKKLTDEKIIN